MHHAIQPCSIPDPTQQTARYCITSTILRRLHAKHVISEDELFHMDRLNRLSYSQFLIDSGGIL